MAQTQGNDAWEDEEDEDEEEVISEDKALIDNTPTKREEVTVKLNDEVFDWREEVVLHRNDTITISVRDLAPASRVEIVADKGGIDLARKIFYSNKEGELDLEIRLGNRKMKGNITLSYTPSGAAKKSRAVHLVIQ